MRVFLHLNIKLQKATQPNILVIHFKEISFKFEQVTGISIQFNSVIELCPSLCNPMDPKHTRLPCPSPTHRAHSNSCPSSRWCHLDILSSVVPFSSHLESFPASGSFPMSQFFPSGGPRIGVSASTSVLPMNTQDCSPLGWTGWISFQSKDSQESSPTPQFKSINSSMISFLYSSTLTSIHDYWKNYSFD